MRTTCTRTLATKIVFSRIRRGARNFADDCQVQGLRPRMLSPSPFDGNIREYNGNEHWTKYTESSVGGRRGGCAPPGTLPCNSGRGSRPYPNASLFFKRTGSNRTRFTIRPCPCQIWPKTLWLNGFELCHSSSYQFSSVAHMSKIV